MIQIERLRAMAREAIGEYQTALRSGGEPSYPQWADDLIVVCEHAQAGMLSRQLAPLEAPLKVPRSEEQACPV